MLLVFFLVTSSMDTDKGVPRQLPPPENMTEVQELMVKDRNVLTIEIDEHDRLTCNKEDITPDQLTKRVEEFVANTKNDPKLPEKSTREVHLMGKCQVSDRHIISIQVNRKTSYNAYIEMQNAVVAGYNHLRNGLAKSRFHHSYAQCSTEEHDAINIVYPQRISEQPPIDHATTAEEGGEP